MGLINSNKHVENDNPVPIHLIVHPELEQIWLQIAKWILLILVLLICFVMHELSTDHRNIIDFEELPLLEAFKHMFVRWLKVGIK